MPLLHMSTRESQEQLDQSPCRGHMYLTGACSSKARSQCRAVGSSQKQHPLHGNLSASHGMHAVADATKHNWFAVDVGRNCVTAQITGSQKWIPDTFVAVNITAPNVNGRPAVL